MPAFRMKCQNNKCGGEFHRFYKSEEFDRLQYGKNQSGIACYRCGMPKMVIIRSNKIVRDKFKPGFQRNIMKYCATYQEYQAWLKKLGLIEMGYDEFPEKTEKETFFNDKMLKKIYQKHGVKLEGNEIKHLKEWVPEDTDEKEAV